MRIRRPSTAMLVALLALFVALGGSATAARTLITGSDIAPGAIKARNIAPGAVTKAKLAPNARGLHGARGATGPRGFAGGPGAKGAAGGFDLNKITWVVGPENAVFPGEARTSTAYCPAGAKAIGGGGANSSARLDASLIVAGGVGWRITYHNDGATPVNGVAALVICALP